MPAPTANTALPGPGTLLYQADWSAGANGWALPADWQVANGFLSNIGTTTDVSVIATSYEAPLPDYAVEADIQAVKYTQLP